MNEGSKYPIASGDRDAIYCDSTCCAAFGSEKKLALVIQSDSNTSFPHFCNANCETFNLPAAEGSEDASINGGKLHFKLKQFEVYSVTVRIIY